MNRLDELLRAFGLHSNTNEWTVTLNKPDYEYLAAVLRAGRELRDAVDTTDAYHDAGEPLESAFFTYDRAVEGTLASEVGNDAEG